VSADGVTPPLVVRRTFAGTREQLFDEWTDPEGMAAWMCPGDIVSSDVQLDLRLGGALRITMRGPNAAYEHRGEITALERPAKLAFTWIAKATDDRPTLVTVEFFARGKNQCEVVLTHDNFPRPEARQQYEGGWARILERLAQHRDALEG
jgi:uncharacterized protein YndB with AHSA1/START domain